MNDITPPPIEDANAEEILPGDENNNQEPIVPRVTLSQRIGNARRNLYHALGGSRMSAALKAIAERNKALAQRKIVQAREKTLDGEMYAAIDQYFKDHASLTAADVVAFTDTPRYTEEFSNDHRTYFLTLAKKTLAINELIEKTFQEGQERLDATRTRNDRKVQLERDKDEERQRYAQEMREAAEEYQEAIQEIIDDANEHIANQEYRDALNKAREGQKLLKSEKYSAYDICRKAFAKIGKGVVGTKSEFRRFHDAIMESYHEQLQYIIERAEAGIKYETRRLTGMTDDIPENVTWRNLYRGNLLVGFHVPDAPGIAYNLEIQRRFVSRQDPSEDVFLVKQSKVIDGKQLSAFMRREGRTMAAIGEEQEWEIMDPPGFFQSAHISPVPAPAQGQLLPFDVVTLSDGYYRVMIQKEKNGPSVNMMTLFPLNNNANGIRRTIGNP